MNLDYCRTVSVTECLVRVFLSANWSNYCPWDGELICYWSLFFLQQLKQKGELEDNDAVHSFWTNSPGPSNVVSSPFQTPVSAKGPRAYSRSKGTKGNKAAPHTPISNAG